MKCQRCGADLENKFIKINGVLMCENCAREATRDLNSALSSAFPMLDELSGGLFGAGLDLDFANTRISCSKCGSTLRDIEKTGRVGCIECYNTFNETILKFILKRQGNSKYKGRNPGEAINLDELLDGESDDEAKAQEAKPKKTTVKKTSKPEEKKVEQKESKTDKEDKLAKLSKADLGMLSDSDLNEGMKLAVEKEDYALAARFRDELKGRKGDK